MDVFLIFINLKDWILLPLLCLSLPWEVTAVMLADTIDGYRQHEKRLISEVKSLFGFTNTNLNGLDDGVVNWVERFQPRRCDFYFFFNPPWCSRYHVFT